jgi:hypothetical protein
MAKVTAAFVKRELGDLDDLEVARIVALDPSEAEVVEARAWLEGNEDVARALDGPSSGVVAQIVAIAQTAAEAEEDDDFL